MSLGLLQKIFSKIAHHEIIVDDIIQNLYDNSQMANLGFTIELNDLQAAQEAAEALIAELGITKFEISHPVSKVSVVGIGMRSHSGVAQRMFEALAGSSVNIQNISTSEIVISCVVSAEDGHKALRLLHAAFELDK